MPISVALKAAIQSNVTFLAPIWAITALDGTVAAYAMHTRPLTFNGINYSAAGPMEATRSQRKKGIAPDSSQLNGVFDDILTKGDALGDRWKGATIIKEIVNYLDLTMGSVERMKGEAGKFGIIGGNQFTVEFLGKSQRLQQEIGDLTSPTDRRLGINDLGIDLTPYTVTTTVSSVTSNRVFVVASSPADHYYAHGLATFTSGANSGLSIEIKDNIGSSLTVQLPLRSPVGVGDHVTLLAGYDGTRAKARELGSTVVLNGQFEPDLPSITELLTYPNSGI